MKCSCVKQKPVSSPLYTENLVIGYGGVPLCSCRDLLLDRGRVIALLGKNGTGKSTLIRTLTGDLHPVSGHVLLEGRELHQYTVRERAKMIALVSTSTGMSGGLTVEELVGLGRHPHIGWMGRLSDSDRHIVSNAMEDVGISFKKDSFVADLSDGERQKALIARAIAQQCPVIVMDEPFSYLDVSARIEILSLLKKIAREREAAILFSTHDVAQALRMADYIWMYYPDRRMVCGSPSEIVRNGEINCLFDNHSVVFSPEKDDFIEA